MRDKLIVEEALAEALLCSEKKSIIYGRIQNNYKAALDYQFITSIVVL